MDRSYFTTLTFGLILYLCNIAIFIDSFRNIKRSKRAISRQYRKLDKLDKLYNGIEPDKFYLDNERLCNAKINGCSYILKDSKGKIIFSIVSMIALLIMMVVCINNL